MIVYTILWDDAYQLKIIIIPPKGYLCTEIDKCSATPKKRVWETRLQLKLHANHFQLHLQLQKVALRFTVSYDGETMWHPTLILPSQINVFRNFVMIKIHISLYFLVIIVCFVALFSCTIFIIICVVLFSVHCTNYS